MSTQQVRVWLQRVHIHELAGALDSGIMLCIELLPDRAAAQSAERLPTANYPQGAAELLAVLQVRVWLRPMAEADGPGSGDSSGSGSGSDAGEADFAEYGETTGPDALARLAHGWTAFVVGVVAPCHKDRKP